MIFSNPLYKKGLQCPYCNDTKKDYTSLETQAKKPSEKLPPKKLFKVGSTMSLMTCQEYDDLINQGFRRAGAFLYKHDLLRSCCQLYTILTNMSYFTPSKKQRKAINKFIKEICPDESVLSSTVKNTFNLEQLVEAQLKSTRFKIKYEPSKFSAEKFKLYKKYQVAIHKDDPSKTTKTSFKKILCDTPFHMREEKGSEAQWQSLDINNWSSKNLEKRIGPAHACYYLDDKLIAFSVLDFIPSGVVSNYFAWDPDYAHLSLGTVLAIRELQMCKALGYDWYYLGSYIDDCDKFNYKAKFGGEVLDVCTETYYPLDEVKPFLKNGRYFVIGTIGETEHGKEMDYEATGHTKSRSIGKMSYNAAEDIYGDEEVYTNAEEQANQLLNDYDIGPTGTHKLPSVMPGLIQLLKIEQWLDEGIIDDDTLVKINTSSGVRTFYFGSLDKGKRGRYIECVRLFGLEKMKQSVMFYQSDEILDTLTAILFCGLCMIFYFYIYG